MTDTKQSNSEPSAQQDDELHIEGAVGQQGRAGLSREPIDPTPPWRKKREPSIVEKLEEADSVYLMEPAQLRNSLFVSDERSIPAATPGTPSAKTGPDLGKPHGGFLQRLRKRR